MLYYGFVNWSFGVKIFIGLTPDSVQGAITSKIEYNFRYKLPEATNNIC